MISNKVCSQLLLVLLFLLACVFTLLAFVMFLLLCFTGSWKCFDDSAILLLDIGMCNIHVIKVYSGFRLWYLIQFLY